MLVFGQLVPYNAETYEECMSLKDVGKTRKSDWEGRCLVMRYRKPGQPVDWRRLLVTRVLKLKTMHVEGLALDEEADDGEPGAFMKFELEDEVEDEDVRGVKTS